jgi:hypothetical protein
MEFHFDIVETNMGAVVVEADDYEEAVATANDFYHAGAIMWGDPEVTTVLNRSYD